MAQPFTSIRYPFAIDASRSRLQEENHYSQHIDQLVKQVLFTAPGERVNRTISDAASSALYSPPIAKPLRVWRKSLSSTRSSAGWDRQILRLRT